MTRRKGKRDSLSANTTASTPDLARLKKPRNEDEQSVLETILSKNPYSTGGTLVNESDLGDFGGDVDDGICEEEDPQQQHQQLQQQRQQQQQQNQAAAVKVPPLMVKTVELRRLQATMKAIKVSAVYKICRVGIKVVLSSKEDYQKAKTYLERSKAEFYTFDMPSEKPFKAVIRGLPNMDASEIKTDLEQRYKLKPLAVFPMSRHDKTKTYRDCLYLVHFKKGSVSLGALKAAKVVLDVIVSWEAYRGANRDVTQCMRCLQYGHGSRNCRIKPRCAVCTQQHETKECIIEEAAEAKCANCGGNHRATDRSCGKREEYKQIRSQAVNQNQTRRRRQAAPPTNVENFPHLSRRNDQPNPRPPLGLSAATPGGSYRDMLRQQPLAGHARVQNNQPQHVDEEAPLLTPEQLLPIFHEMCSKMKQCRTRADQILCLGEFIIRHG